MIKGNIAIPSANSLKRPRPKRKPRTYPENMPVIVEGKTAKQIARERRWERFFKPE